MKVVVEFSEYAREVRVSKGRIVAPCVAPPSPTVSYHTPTPRPVLAITLASIATTLLALAVAGPLALVVFVATATLAYSTGRRLVAQAEAELRSLLPERRVLRVVAAAARACVEAGEPEVQLEVEGVQVRARCGRLECVEYDEARVYRWALAVAAPPLTLLLVGVALGHPVPPLALAATATTLLLLARRRPPCRRWSLRRLRVDWGAVEA